ncbi:MFS transporter (fragment) (modular protein) [Oenococcus oeni]
MLPGSLLGAATAPIAGSWYDKVGAKFPLILSNSLIVFGAFLLWIFTDHLTIWLIMFFYLILRLGFNLGFGNTMSDASKYVDNKKRADQSSLFNMAQQYAGSIGTAVMSAMIAFQSIIFSNISSSKATLIGGRLDFAILFILAILSLSLTIFCQHLIKKNNQSISNQ